MDGITIVETRPTTLLVPAALETIGEKNIAVIYPASSTNVNPFTAKFELAVEPRLDAASATRWYMWGEPSIVPVLEYSYLSGSEGVQLSSREGWNILGMEFRAVLDFGVGAVGYRGVFMNPGA